MLGCKIKAVRQGRLLYERGKTANKPAKYKDVGCVFLDVNKIISKKKSPVRWGELPLLASAPAHLIVQKHENAKR